VVFDPDIDVVIEVIGGIDPPFHLVSCALSGGKDVVTANKELIAKHGRRLVPLAAREGKQFLFEASVGGAIPIVRALKESFAGDRVTSITGVLNGTSNFVLDRIQSTGCSLEDAVQEASLRGYAERDATDDISGRDAACKLVVLCESILGRSLNLDEIAREGITSESVFTPPDGKVLKQIARARLTLQGVEAEVGLQALDRSHPLANLSGPTNGVMVHLENAGDLSFFGAGAGGRATSTSILGDLVTLARHRSEPSSAEHASSVVGDSTLVFAADGASR
jgi:homoserine dehydrogenase